MALVGMIEAGVNPIHLACSVDIIRYLITERNLSPHGRDGKVEHVFTTLVGMATLTF